MSVYTDLIKAAKGCMAYFDHGEFKDKVAPNVWLQKLRIALSAAEKATNEPCDGVVGKGGATVIPWHEHCPGCNPEALRLAGELALLVALVDSTTRMDKSRVEPSRDAWDSVAEKARELKEALGG